MSVREAILARVESVVTPAYDGLVPTDANGRPVAQRYAVLYAAAGERTSDDLAMTAGRYAYRWQVTSVGTTPQQADWVATRCRDALLDERVLVEGWETGEVEHTSSSPIRRDDDIPGGALFYAVDTYQLPATR